MVDFEVDVWYVVGVVVGVDCLKGCCVVVVGSLYVV